MTGCPPERHVALRPVRVDRAAPRHAEQPPVPHSDRRLDLLLLHPVQSEVSCTVLSSQIRIGREDATLPTMVSKSYVLGSAREQMDFLEDGIDYQPSGIMHAVDPDAPFNPKDGALGYALCGAPVHIWHQRQFDPTDQHSHDACLSLSSQIADEPTSLTAHTGR